VNLPCAVPWLVIAGDGAGAAEFIGVLDVVPFEEEDESAFVGLLQVEAG